MTDSILITIKKLLGAGPDYPYYDTDIIIHINTCIGILYRLGLGYKPFVITGETETWSDFLGNQESYLESVKTYIFLKCKLIFDPPTSSSILASYQELVKELEFTISVEVDPPAYEREGLW